MQKIKVLCVFVVFSYFIYGGEVENLGITPKEKVVVDSKTLDLELISATAIYSDLDSIPKNVIIITAEEIKKQGAKTINEVLKSVPNLKTDSFTNLEPIFDLRGQGDTSKSNVLVLVNGVPANSVDGSGYIVSNIPIDQIERVEVNPTGGAVLYGDGTVGGTVNIITKAPKNQKNYGLFSVDGGSYNSLKSDFAYGTNLFEKFSLQAGYMMGHSNAERDYTAKDSKNFNGDIKYILPDESALYFKYNYYDTKYQLPGSLFKDEVEENRNQALMKSDGANTRNTFNLNYLKKFSKNFDFALYNSYEFSKNAYIYYVPSSSYYYETDNLYLRPQIKYSYLEEDEVIFGGDYRKGKTNVTKSEYSTLGNRTKESSGLFLLNKNSIYNFIFSEGIRTQQVKSDYINLGKKESIDIREEAYDFGISYLLPSGGALFTNYVHSFRIPTTDELAWWYGNVKPEISNTFEVGYKDMFKNSILNLTLFKTFKEDEIVYATAPNNYSYNYNLEGKTERQGVELSGEHLFENFSIRESFGYIDSEITSGRYNGKELPLVSKYKVTLGGTYNILSNLKLNLDVNYFSDYYASTDFDNLHGKFNAYTVVNSNIIFDWTEVFSLNAGVNNILDEKYHTYVGWSEFSNKEYYYPANGRNFFVRLKYVY
ncbi:MAG: TonB-dependent receptor domain-containing protein [Fusobacteriaceae bacterium]